MRIKKALCLTLAGALVVASLPLPVQSVAPLCPISVPKRLGAITQFQAGSAGTVVLIQDLHLHAPTQHRITQILSHLYAQKAVSGPVAVEGLYGPYDTSALAAFPSGKLKNKLVHYFVDKGEMSGDEAFSILRGEGHSLVGVDNPSYYQINCELYRGTLAARHRLLSRLQQVEKRLDVLHGTPNRSLDARVSQVEAALPTLLRLLRQHATFEDARYVAQRLPQYVEFTQQLLGLEKIAMPRAEIHEVLKSTVDFYAVALMRDTPLARNTLVLLKTHSTVPLVVGGFHTAGLIREFRKANVGVAVITPRLDDISEEYGSLYESRMRGLHESYSQVARELRITTPEERDASIEESSVRVLMDIPYLLPLWNRAWQISQRRSPWTWPTGAFRLSPRTRQHLSWAAAGLAVGMGGAGLSIGMVVQSTLPSPDHLPVTTTGLTPEQELKALREFAVRLRKEIAVPGSGDLPIAMAISDQHGTIDKFDALLLDGIRKALPMNVIPDTFKLDPDMKLVDQLSEFGIRVPDHLQGRLYIHNLGDLMDRGPFGVKVFLRSIELVEAGLSDYIVGNHCFWEFLNLQAFHLPWYDGYNFYDYSDAYDEREGRVQDLVQAHYKSEPKSRTPGWWAEKAAEYMNYQKKRQKEIWAPLELRINGKSDPGKDPIPGVFRDVETSLEKNSNAYNLWIKLIGKNSGGADISTGVRSVGTMSVQWWENLLRDFKSEYAQLSSVPGFNPDLPAPQAWAQAIAMMETEIIPVLREDLEQKLSEGKWYWRVMEAIVLQNYKSPEWWGMDWIFHKDWGTAVLAERNQSLSPDHQLDNAHYLDDPLLNMFANFARNHFTLYHRDIYQNVYMHGFLPVDETTGEFYFTYKGQEYRGRGKPGQPSVWQGLDLIQSDMRNPDHTMTDLYEAIRLVNEWYADDTTKIKAPDVARYINRFGAEHLATMNDYNRLFGGHLPLVDFTKKEVTLGVLQSAIHDDSIVFTDFGMGTRFGGRGAWVYNGAEGMYHRGYEHEKSGKIVDHPRTVKTVEGVDGPVERVLFHNPGVPRERYLPRVLADVERRIRELESLSAPVHETPLAPPYREVQSFTVMEPTRQAFAREVRHALSTQGNDVANLIARKMTKSVKLIHFDGALRVDFVDGSWLSIQVDDSDGHIRIDGEDYTVEKLKNQENAVKETLLELTQEVRDGAALAQKLRTPLAAATSEMAKRFENGTMKGEGYGVANGAAIDGSHADVGNQGYFAKPNEGKYVKDVQAYSRFFDRFKGAIAFVVKLGIGGQHTPWEGIAQVFAKIGGKFRVSGEYELSQPDALALQRGLSAQGADWSGLALIASSKSGSTDETMVKFIHSLVAMIEHDAAAEGLNGAVTSRVFLDTLRDVNFIDGKERKKDLFKVDDTRFATNKLHVLFHDRLQAATPQKEVTREQVMGTLRRTLSRMVFETTPKPEQSRLAAFIMNSGLMEALGPEFAPIFIEMYENVGGRWTGDLHMMALLALYKVDPLVYFNRRRDQISKVRAEEHDGVRLGHRLLNDGIRQMAMIVPDELFWFGKSIEQNFNESIWQPGYLNIKVYRESEWKAQEFRYRNKPERLVINLGNPAKIGSGVTVYQYPTPTITAASKTDDVALMFADLQSFFYGLTTTVGNRLIAREVSRQGLKMIDANLSDLDNPVTKIVRKWLYFLQFFVELGKGLADENLTALQNAERQKPGAILAREQSVIESARRLDVKSNVPGLTPESHLKDIRQLAELIERALRHAQATGRTFVPIIYLEGEKYQALRTELTHMGIEWVLQGTGDQHININQVAHNPKDFLPFIVSVVPENMIPGLPAVGFGKEHLHNISPNLLQDVFAEAIYDVFASKLETVGIPGGEAVFLRLLDTPDVRQAFKTSAATAVERVGLAESPARPHTSNASIEPLKMVMDYTRQVVRWAMTPVMALRQRAAYRRETLTRVAPALQALTLADFQVTAAPAIPPSPSRRAMALFQQLIPSSRRQEAGDAFLAQTRQLFGASA